MAKYYQSSDVLRNQNQKRAYYAKRELKTETYSARWLFSIPHHAKTIINMDVMCRSKTARSEQTKKNRVVMIDVQDSLAG
jgi:ubiquinone biosynthesis protein COQ9